jgi:hypothetical protein
VSKPKPGGVFERPPNLGLCWMLRANVIGGRAVGSHQALQKRNPENPQGSFQSDDFREGTGAIPELGQTRHITPCSGNIPHRSLLESGESTQRMERELNTDLESIRREVSQRLKDGKTKGETEVEITSRLVWLERQKQYALCNAMEEIFRSAADALDVATDTSCKTGNLLKWRKPLH